MINTAINTEIDYPLRLSITTELINDISEVEHHRNKSRMVFAAVLSDAMKEKGISKIELAHKLNKKPSTISLWLSGTHNFTLDTLSDIERVLGVSFFKQNKNKDMEYIYENVITVDKNRLGGLPCVKNERLSVNNVVRYLQSGNSVSDLLRDFPKLTKHDIEIAVEFSELNK